MLVDEVEIKVKAGHGGPGKVSFFPMKNGPNGGDGGEGGSVYVEVNPNMSDLHRFAGKHDWKAGDGGTGDVFLRTGPNGDDMVLQVPKSTTIIDLENGEQIEMIDESTRVLLCQGGIGGRGNDRFKSPTNQTPRNSEPGRPGQERRLKLILKLIADIGLIGLPNAGKSSLLNELTAAKAKIANYAFTTLEPNLGVMNKKIIADIPGLIEGASAGKGLGIKFLKHIEKVGIILHCISVESKDIIKDYETVEKELAAYNPELTRKSEVILLTKHDLATPAEVSAQLKKLEQIGKKVYPVSIHDYDSLETIKKLIG